MFDEIFDSQANDSFEERFMWLVRFAKPEKIKDFLSNASSMDLNHPTRDLKTPVTSAIDRGDPRILSFLLEKNSKGLNDTLTQPWGRTSLMYASFVSRDPEILEALLKKGADALKIDERGWTCLWYATLGGRSKIVKYLLETVDLIHGRDFHGRTPLMTAACRSNTDILSLLLDHGADIDARDNAGYTALQIAIFWRKRDAAIKLIERGSDTSVLTPSTGTSVGELCKTCMPNVLLCLEPAERTPPRLPTSD